MNEEKKETADIRRRERYKREIQVKLEKRYEIRVGYHLCSLQHWC